MWLVLWFSIGTFWLFVVQKKANHEASVSGFLASFVVESFWAYILTAAPLVGIVYSLNEIFLKSH